jgi:site-specific recombinase XerD
VSLDGGGLAREPVGHNRKEAERRLRAIEVRLDQNVFEPVDNIAFVDWCDTWLNSLRRKETTRRTYRSSLEYAKQAAGRKPLRKVTTEDVRAFLDYIEKVNKSKTPPREVSSTTLAKHLRHLGACLQAAKLEGKLSENPVRLLAPGARPKSTRKRPSYFTQRGVGTALAQAR